jgi:energy-coupling factor transporter ATP-binding protein EcfA2
MLHGHRSVESLNFPAGPFTVLLGRNDAGKSNILETIAGLLDPQGNWDARRTHTSRASHISGGVVVRLDPGTTFDDAVLVGLAEDAQQPPGGIVTFTSRGVVAIDASLLEEPDIFLEPDTLNALAFDAPRLHPLMIDWRVRDLHERVEDAIGAMATSQAAKLRGDWPWLEMIKLSDGQFTYRVPDGPQSRVDQLASLASDLLPDFIDGTISAHVTAATLWGDTPKVLLQFEQRDLGQCADLVDAAGEGVARWMAAATQIALHLMAEHHELRALRDLSGRALSGHILLVDEPEAHLHPLGVASIVRWCHRMVSHGFTVIAATHHEEFLRTASDRVTIVRVTRTAQDGVSSAETISLPTTRQLLELADHIGLNRAAALSLQRAILFVEGPLDEAVLDEFGHLDLDAAGVKIVPIHGTKNLEGLLTAELVLELGLKLGILTDATEPATMGERSNKKRSSEEKKVLRVVERAQAQGLPVPTIFGVVEDDLLFALPPEAISVHYLGGRPFPEWKELVAECRQAEGKTPADSVNWKAYAQERYGLPLTTPEDVRHIVHTLDLNGVAMPSIRRVITEIVDWARPTP